MIGVRWYGQKDLRIEEFPTPLSPDEGWVKIRILACGICGSDIREYEKGPVAISNKNGPRHQTPPVILGHEFTGKVVELGPNTNGVEVGATVVVDAGIPCNDCFYCNNGMHMLCDDRGILGLTKNGAFTEYMNVPVKNCYVMNKNIDQHVLALAEPITVALHAINRGRINEEDEVLIIGGGPIGLLILIALVHQGIKKIGLIEPLEKRRNLALDLGGDYVIDPHQEDALPSILSNHSGVGPSIVFDCVGVKETYLNAIQYARKLGKVVLVGNYPGETPIDFRRLIKTEKELIGSIGRFDEWEDAINLIIKEEKSLKKIISNVITLEEVPEIFKNISENKSDYIKVIVSR